MPAASHVFLQEPASLWMQISNIFFLLSGVFNDLLIIRWALVFAFLFLFIQGLLGFPVWSDSFKPFGGAIGIDTMVWCTVQILVIHGPNCISMHRDERPITLTDDQEKLWRYIYRHSGLSRLLFFNLIVPTLKLITFEQGEDIPVADHFYIILEGMVTAETVHDETGTKAKMKIFSGEMFPVAHIYNNYMNRDSYYGRQFMEPVAASKTVKAFVMPVETLHSMTFNPKANDAWKAMLIATLAQIAEAPYKDFSEHPTESVIASNDAEMSTTVNKLFDPLDASEEPDPDLAGSGKALYRPFRHIWKYCKLTVWIPFISPWPVGLRHTLPPPTDPKKEKVEDLVKDANDSLLMSGRQKVGSTKYLTTSMKDLAESAK